MILKRMVVNYRVSLGDHYGPYSLAWPPLQSLAVKIKKKKKKLFFVQILGGEKLLKFVEKCRWNIFKRPERG